MTVTTDSTAELYVLSHFGQGIVSFRISALFRTDADVNLWVGGPLNRVEDGIQPLIGIVETDWSPFTFTMNWKVTRPHEPIDFERDEPICHVFPVQRGIIDNTTLELASIDSDLNLQRDYEHARDARREFNDVPKTTTRKSSSRACSATISEGHFHPVVTPSRATIPSSVPGYPNRSIDYPKRKPPCLEHPC